MPYTTRADGDVLTASSHNANCRDQVTSTVTSATRPSGTEGQFIYETDTDLVHGYNGGWVQFGGLGAWTTYTPTLTQSGAVTKTVTYARYIRIGRLIICQVSLSITGTGTANAAVTITAPFTAASVGAGQLEVGSGHIFNNSAASTVPGVAVLQSTTTFALLDTTQVTVGVVIGQTGSAFAEALASSDAINVCAMYEAAS